MNMKHSVTKIALLAAACGGVAFAGQAAQAASVIDLVEGGANHYSDETAQGYGVNSPSQDPLEVGDTLRGYVNFNTHNSGSANIGGLTPNAELTGVFHIKVLSKTPTGVVHGVQQYEFTFGPDAGWNFADHVLGTNNNSSGAMVLLYDDSSNNFSFADASNTATDGNLFLAAGFTGAQGEIWTASGPDDIGAASSENAGVQFALANFAINRVSSQGELGSTALLDQTSPYGVAEFIGSSSIRGAEGDVADAGFLAGGNTEFTFTTAVPTPAALGMGLALMGFMGARRRRRQA